MNHFSVITITHKSANINHIGRYIPSFSSNSQELSATLHKIKDDLGITELLYLATCNRLMFFVVQESMEMNRNYLLRFFVHLHPNIPAHCLNDMADLVHVYRGTEAINHIFEVAASLDSLVVGEREILRQLKDAYDFCSEQKLTGDNIRLALKTAIPLAKEIYTNTRIGENSVSVVSLAMQQLMALQPDKNARIIMIGAGQTNNLVSKFLLAHGFHNFTVFNRTLGNAEHLAGKLKGSAYALADLAHYGNGFDIIVSCTGATEPIITETVYRHLLGAETDPKIIVDLAVPNDVAGVVKTQYPVHYIEVEQLRELAESNLNLRKEEVVKAKVLVAQKLEEFKLLMRHRRVERGMAVIPGQIREIKEKALNTVFQKEIAQLDDKSKELLQKVLGYLEQKYIGIPIKVAKNVLSEELAATEPL